MFLGLLIGFLFCFVSGLLLDVVLLFNNASWLKKNKHKRFWERTVDLLFSICQAGLSIAGIVAITIAFITDTEPHWLDPVILCTLQLIAGANHTLLSHVAIASVWSWTLWNEALQKHLRSGNSIPERVRTLRRLSLANVRTSEIRQGIILSYIDRLVCSYK
ncbi:hypothetical protein BDY21DRAFT_422038 [Lineolata rhizophorae]|uniref:Uncharacterized protein n=1 Tax=Lineolata rhizophorae TaxID=578093 RepID=A0A6A6NZ94_9PEZI|nr:hypothetical protein BDY21DRAFT_422038 [Lineolata rhizophorae]